MARLALARVMEVMQSPLESLLSLVCFAYFSLVIFVHLRP